MVVGRGSAVVGRQAFVVGPVGRMGCDDALVWHSACYAGGMIIRSLDELQVFQRANELADEISAILDRPCLKKFPELHDQLAEASAAVGPRISEGFGQGTDRHCAHLQRVARGSVNEMIAHLSVARGRRCISREEFAHWESEYTILGKRLTKWIQHLREEDRKDRG